MKFAFILSFCSWILNLPRSNPIKCYKSSGNSNGKCPRCSARLTFFHAVCANQVNSRKICCHFEQMMWKFPSGVNRTQCIHFWWEIKNAFISMKLHFIQSIDFHSFCVETFVKLMNRSGKNPMHKLMCVSHCENGVVCHVHASRLKSIRSCLSSCLFNQF